MIIKNGLVFCPDGKFRKKNLSFHERIIGISDGEEAAETLNADGCYVVPGFVDTHMHGAVGENFLDFNKETAEKICRFEAQNGTTTLVPAISAAGKEAMKHSVRYITEEAKQLPKGCAKLLGIHLEGPFLSPEYLGSMLREAVRPPDMHELDELCEAGEGLVKLVTIAPELKNGCMAVQHMAENGIAVSIGHSAASYEEAQKAFACGASRTTHTFNAMSPLRHRSPGVVGAAMSNRDVSCELICDFFHVHKEVVKLLYRLKGADKITMITDSEVGTGLPDGTYTVCGQTLTMRSRKTYTEDGTIFGGSTVLLDGVKNLLSIGVPLEDAVKMASYNGAAGAGIADRVGSLEKGKDADIVILDSQLGIRNVLINGRLL